MLRRVTLFKSAPAGSYNSFKFFLSASCSATRSASARLFERLLEECFASNFGYILGPPSAEPFMATAYLIDILRLIVLVIGRISLLSQKVS